MSTRRNTQAFKLNCQSKSLRATEDGKRQQLRFHTHEKAGPDKTILEVALLGGCPKVKNKIGIVHQTQFANPAPNSRAGEGHLKIGQACKVLRFTRLPNFLTASRPLPDCIAALKPPAGT